MKQREIKDQDNVSWTCTQAFAGTDGAAGREAAKRAVEDGKVTVICTPSGGAQTVRLELSQNWLKEMSDDDLSNALLDVKDKS